MKGCKRKKTAIGRLSAFYADNFQFKTKSNRPTAHKVNQSRFERFCRSTKLYSFQSWILCIRLCIVAERWLGWVDMEHFLLSSCSKDRADNTLLRSLPGRKPLHCRSLARLGRIIRLSRWDSLINRDVFRSSNRHMARGVFPLRLHNHCSFPPPRSPPNKLQLEYRKRQYLNSANHWKTFIWIHNSRQESHRSKTVHRFLFGCLYNRTIYCSASYPVGSYGKR